MPILLFQTWSLAFGIKGSGMEDSEDYDIGKERNFVKTFCHVNNIYYFCKR